MSVVSYRAALGLACLLVTPASGQVLTHNRPHRGQHRADRHGHLQRERLPRVGNRRSGEMEERLKKNPQMDAQYLTGFTTARGALATATATTTTTATANGTACRRRRPTAQTNGAGIRRVLGACCGEAVERTNPDVRICPVGCLRKSGDMPSASAVASD
jgi:hypothetical protein